MKVNEVSCYLQTFAAQPNQELPVVYCTVVITMTNMFCGDGKITGVLIRVITLTHVKKTKQKM